MSALSEKEAVEMRGKLEKSDVSVDTARNILESLLDKTITMQLLLDTKIGMIVKSTRKHSDAKIAELASEVTAKWKEVVKNAGGGGGGGAGGGGSTPKAPTAKATDPEIKEEKKEEKKEKKVEEKKGKGAPEVKKEKASLRREVSTASSGGGGGGLKREKVRALLAKSLGGSEETDVPALAARIEEALHDHFDGDMEKYTEQVKTVKFNISDPKNFDFKQGVLKGEILPEQIATLSSSQMAGRDKIEQKKANMEAKIFQDKLFITAGNLGAESDMFKCSKCKKNRTTFYQKQTRSADEPMTVFITCRNCGHEWRDGG